MRSILTVTTPATDYDLTTLDRLKGDLGITATDTDDRLQSILTAVSKAVATYLDRPLAQETVSETFRLDPYESPEFLILTRTPIASIASVTVDDSIVPSDQYEYDRETGQLYRLDASGYRCVWIACKSVIVAYVGGYLLPSQTDRDLEENIELGALAWMKSSWFSVRRDPSLRSENILEGLYSYQMFAPSDSPDGLPPEAATFLSRYRNPAV